MRGASVVRRRSVTNPGDTAGSVNGGQEDGGGSGLLAGGSADGPGGSRRDSGQQDPLAATSGQAGQVSHAARGNAPQAGPGGPAVTPVALPPGPSGTGSAARTATARSRRQASAQSRFALANWRGRRGGAAVIAVPTLIAAALGSFLIYGDTNTWVASGRIQHLAQLNASVVKLTQALEDERDLSAGYAANPGHRADLANPLKQAQAATNAAAQTVANEASGVTTGAGYQPTTVQDLVTLIANFNDLPPPRQLVTSSKFQASQITRAYTDNILYTANTFSASAGAGANDSQLQGNTTTLAALLLVENEM